MERMSLVLNDQLLRYLCSLIGMSYLLFFWHEWYLYELQIYSELLINALIAVTCVNRSRKRLVCAVHNTCTVCIITNDNRIKQNCAGTSSSVVLKAKYSETSLDPQTRKCQCGNLFCSYFHMLWRIACLIKLCKVQLLFL